MASRSIRNKNEMSKRENFLKPVKPGSPFIKHEPGPDSVWLVSRLDHPTEISYKGNDALLIPPRGKLAVYDKKLLGKLPVRVYIVPYNKLTK